MGGELALPQQSLNLLGWSSILEPLYRAAGILGTQKQWLDLASKLHATPQSDQQRRPCSTVFKKMLGLGGPVALSEHW